MLDELDDFALPESLAPVGRIALPPYVPQVDLDPSVVAQPPDIIGLSLKRFLSPEGRGYERGIVRAERLREAGATRIVLVATGRDDLLEHIWTDSPRFMDALIRARIDLVFGPAFSLYLTRPPLEREFNRARNLRLYSELADRGLSVIPAVGFTNAVEAAYTGRWVERLGLRAVFLDLQSVGRHWPLVRQLLPVFLEPARSLERVVVNGVAAPFRVVELREILRETEFVLTNGYAYHLGVSGRDFARHVEGRFVRTRSAAPKRAILPAVIRLYERAVAVGCLSYRRADHGMAWPRVGDAPAIEEQIPLL